MSAPDQRCLPARAKLWIASIDVPNHRDYELRAQYNPKELQIDKQIPWLDKNRDGQSKEDAAQPSKQSDLEFNSAAQRTMQIELLFDGYEQGESVQPDVDRLERLSSILNPGDPNKDLRRPHHCIIVWSSQQEAQRGGKQDEPQRGIPPFRCVIESFSTKYTMWSTNGIPLRATCTIKVKEAEHISRATQDPQPYYRERPPNWDRPKGRPLDDPPPAQTSDRRSKR